MKKDNSNGRVTLAVLKRDIEHLSEKLDDFIAHQDEKLKSHDSRLINLERAVAQSKGFFVAISAIIALLTVANFLIRIWK